MVKRKWTKEDVGAYIKVHGGEEKAPPYDYIR